MKLDELARKNPDVSICITKHKSQHFAQRCAIITNYSDLIVWISRLYCGRGWRLCVGEETGLIST